MKELKKVLLVDDDRIVLQIIKHYLGDEFVVYSATTGEEALQKLEAINPDVMLLDVVLPDMSGLDLFVGLTEMEKFKNIPVIMLTSMECNEEISGGLETGQFDYIQKPVSRLELLARINAAYKLKNYLKKIHDADLEKVTLINELEYRIKEENEIKEQAKQADVLRSVQELAGAIAHEFSQPLQVLTLYYGLMQKHEDKTVLINKSKAMIDRISDLVHKLKTITNLTKQDYVGSQILNLHASSTPVAAVPEIVVRHKVESILVAEDEPGILESIVEMLELNGYIVKGTANGKEALDLAKANKYDLIISDVNIPDVSGPEMFNILKNNGYQGYFIFMTGYEVSGEMKKSLDMADGIILKPFEFTDFLSKIEKLNE